MVLEIKIRPTATNTSLLGIVVPLAGKSARESGLAFFVPCRGLSANATGFVSIKPQAVHSNRFHADSAGQDCRRRPVSRQPWSRNHNKARHSRVKRHPPPIRGTDALRRQELTANGLLPRQLARRRPPRSGDLPASLVSRPGLPLYSAASTSFM